MAKRAFLLILFAFIASAAFSASMKMSAYAMPTSVSLDWTDVSGADFYDIYKDDAFVVRLDAQKISDSSYVVEKLNSNTEFVFKIAARKKDNQTLAAAKAVATTSSWDGVYQWVNETEHTNNGKLKSLTLRVETKLDPVYGQFMELYYVPDNADMEYKIFPLFAFDDKSAFEWHKYKDKSVAGVSYRTNAELFNTSPFTPGKWKVYSIVIDSNGATAYIQTSALGMEFLTTTVFEFYLEGSEMKLSLNTTGEQKIVDNYLFKNPNPGQGDAFILNKIS